FWHYCRTMPIPDSLAQKMALFKNQGHIATYTNGLFMEPSWLAVYAGQNITPSKYDPRLDQVSFAQLRAYLDQLAQTYRDAAGKIPQHKVFLSQFLGNGSSEGAAPASMSLYGGLRT